MFVALIASAWAAPTIAFADLANRTGDPALDGAGAGVAGMLASRLAESGAVRVIERDTLEALLDEQRLTVSKLTEPETAARTGRLLGAQYLVVGELFSVQLPTISVTLRVIDTNTGEVVASKDVVGEVGERGERFFVLVDELSDAILAAMKVQLDPAGHARMSSVERREWDAVVRYGDDLTRISTDNPLALYRQSDHDFSRDEEWKKRWMVYQQDGKALPMPQFSRRIGDDPSAELFYDHVKQLHRHLVRNDVLTFGYGALGIGLIVAGQNVGNGDGDPETPTATQVLGGTLITVMPFHLIFNSAAHAVQMQTARYPGAYYTPEEADRWIHAYNRSLP